MSPYSILLPSVILGSFVLGCSSMNIEVDRFEESEGRSVEGECKISFYRVADKLERECDLIARVRIRDTGFSTDCGSNRIREEVERVACKIGGDAAVLNRMTGPLMTCVQSDADIYRCEETKASPPAETSS